MTTHAEVMRVALEKYLGTEEQWCTGSHAQDADGISCKVGSRQAKSHCAEGAIYAAAMHVTRTLNPRFDLVVDVQMGVEKVLRAEHPDIAEMICARRGAIMDWDWNGRMLPLFNDGITDIDSDGYLVRISSGVGYQGIRAAFEKYLAQCEEKGL